MEAPESQALRRSLNTISDALDRAYADYFKEAEDINDMITKLQENIKDQEFMSLEGEGSKGLARVMMVIAQERASLLSQYPNIFLDPDAMNAFNKVDNDLSPFKQKKLSAKMRMLSALNALTEAQMDMREMKAGMKHVKEEIQHTVSYL